MHLTKQASLCINLLYVQRERQRGRSRVCITCLEVEECGPRENRGKPSSSVVCSSVQFSCSTFHVSDSLGTHGLQHARPPCPSPIPGVYSNSWPSSWWCHPTISSSVIPFSSYLQSCPASGSFQMSQLFASGGQSVQVSASASVPSTNIQDWFPLGWTGWISLQSKGLSGVFYNTTIVYK